MLNDLVEIRGLIRIFYFLSAKALTTALIGVRVFVDIITIQLYSIYDAK